MEYHLNFNFVWRYADKLYWGLALSLELAFVSIVIGMVIGLALALAYTGSGRWVRTACLIIDLRGAMPVPPAINRNRLSAGASGKTKDPDGPRTEIGKPRRSGSKCSPHLPPLSNLIRNWSNESAAVSSGAEAIE